MTTAHAPGKIILFGEHAVVYGRPAIAVPVSQVQATAEVVDADRPGVWIQAPDIRLRARLDDLSPANPLAAAVQATLAALQIDPPPSLQIDIHSTIPVAAGLGSGAAVSVALIRALSAHLGRPLPDERVSELAYAVEKLHHGTPSGIDNTVIAQARPVCFVRGRPIETLQVGAPFTLVIGDTGVHASTRDSVAAVRSLWEAEPRRWEAVFERIGGLALQARRALEQGDTAALGPLMDANHALLQELTVSSPELDRLVLAARRAGASGAKLSGGGRGGNMIALVTARTAQPVREELLAAGAVRALVTRVARGEDGEPMGNG